MVRRYCALGVALTGSCSSVVWRHGMLGGIALHVAATSRSACRAPARRRRVDRWRPQAKSAQRGRGAPRAPDERPAVPDRRPEPRLPRVLRAARVDRDLDRRADQRDLRLRLDAGEDRHRVRRAARRWWPGTPAPPGAPSCSPSTRPSGARARICSSSSGPRWNRWSRRSATRNVRIEGYEADDVIASLAERALRADPPVPVMIVTGDRDVFQLIDEDGLVKVMATARGITETKIYDRQAVIDRYGIAPELIPDFYGLKGDTSDNIPGIPGIGDKTASELLQRFGTLEEVLAQRRAGQRRQAQREPPRARRGRAHLKAARDGAARPGRRLRRRRRGARASPTARGCARSSASTSCATRCAGWRRRWGTPTSLRRRAPPRSG